MKKTIADCICSRKMNIIITEGKMQGEKCCRGEIYNLDAECGRNQKALREARELLHTECESEISTKVK